MSATLQIKRGTAAAIAAANPTPAAGEIIFETDTRKAKVGDGSTAYNTLSYALGAVADSITDAVTDVAPSQNAVFDALALKIPTSYLDTDGTLAANSDVKIATQKAVKTYADQLLGAADSLTFKGAIDASANPNYPAANAGDVYRISVAGKIGGASGPNVEIGDTIYCILDASSAGTHAAVGANWVIIQSNLDGAVIGPASTTDSFIALFDGTTGKLIKAHTSTVANLTLDGGVIS